MERKYYKYKYKWSQLNLVVDCTRCGNNIPLQDLQSPPKCNDCGNVNTVSWEQTLKEIDIAGADKNASVNKKMLGSADAKMKLEPVVTVNCYHCKKELVLPEDKGVEDYSCTHCNQPVQFTEFAEMEELIFYRAGSGKIDTSTLQLIAVRCVSCGAPLEADPTKNNFHCKFCSTENILPPSLRYKVVLDDFFVGSRDSKFLKLTSFSLDGKKIEQVLRENGRESFADDQLDQILLQNKLDTAIYQQITQEFGYLPSDKILHKLFNTTTNVTIIDMVGKRLQKSPEEINTRLDSFLPDYKARREETYQTNRIKSQKKKQKKSYSWLIFTLTCILVTIIIILLSNS